MLNLIFTAVAGVVLLLIVVIWTTIAWRMRVKEHDRKADELKMKHMLELLQKEHEDGLKSSRQDCSLGPTGNIVSK